MSLTEQLDAVEAALVLAINRGLPVWNEAAESVVAALALMPGLRERIAAMSEQLEADRTAVADCMTAANKAVDSRGWLTEGRGSYEWNDDKWHEEFYAAATDIKKALAPLTAIASNWKDCPMSADAVAKARVDLRTALAAAEVAAAERESRIDDLEAQVAAINDLPDADDIPAMLAREQRTKALETALRIYADDENWSSQVREDGVIGPKVVWDHTDEDKWNGPDLARAVLANQAGAQEPK